MKMALYKCGILLLFIIENYLCIHRVHKVPRKGTNIRCVLHWSSSISALLEHLLFWDVSVAISDVMLGGVVKVVGLNLARGKIFTASIGSVDSLYSSVFVYCVNLHQFLILCSSKAMMFPHF